MVSPLLVVSGLHDITYLIKLFVFQGDSGGPLECDTNTGRILVGITSWGASGCLTNYPAGYTRVSKFRDWITDKTGV